MPAEHPAGKPRVGKFVDYFNPKLMQRIGFTEGYGRRFEGPYAALVVNNLGHGLVLRVYLPGVNSIEMDDVAHKDEVVAGHDRFGSPQSEKGYWDWQSPIEAARAAKELKPNE